MKDPHAATTEGLNITDQPSQLRNRSVVSMRLFSHRALDSTVEKVNAPTSTGQLNEQLFVTLVCFWVCFWIITGYMTWDKLGGRKYTLRGRHFSLLPVKTVFNIASSILAWYGLFAAIFTAVGMWMEFRGHLDSYRSWEEASIFLASCHAVKVWAYTFVHYPHKRCVDLLTDVAAKHPLRSMQYICR